MKSSVACLFGLRCVLVRSMLIRDRGEFLFVSKDSAGYCVQAFEAWLVGCENEAYSRRRTM
jgi:hypothetical protein